MVTRFFTRACPMLLDLWAVAYWSLTPSHHSMVLRQAIDAITQCVLVLGGGRLRIAKAEGRPPGVQGSVQPNGAHRTVAPLARPVLRQGEALLVEHSGVSGWRNVGRTMRSSSGSCATKPSLRRCSDATSRRATCRRPAVRVPDRAAAGEGRCAAFFWRGAEA
jgi:hypothetical protein